MFHKVPNTIVRREDKWRFLDAVPPLICTNLFNDKTLRTLNWLANVLVWQVFVLAEK